MSIEIEKKKKRRHTGGMKAGYKYTKKKKWYHNEHCETQIFEGDPVPETFIAGRLPKVYTAWNAGLTKKTDKRLAAMSEAKTGKKRGTKYTDDYLITNFLESGLFSSIYESNTLRNTGLFLHLPYECVHRCIKLGNLESEEHHKKRLYEKTYTAEWREKHGNVLKGKNVWTKGRKSKPEWVAKQKQSYAARTEDQRQLSKLKEFQTRKANGSYLKHMTKAERKLKEALLTILKEEDIIYQYRDEVRYPFNCDFYLPCLDTFIEVNQYPSHGGHPYSSEDPYDQKKLATWQAKVQEGKTQYKNWIYTWTDLDCRKRDFARRHDLKYVIIYNISNIDTLISYLIEQFNQLPSIAIKKIESIALPEKIPIYDITVNNNNNNFILDNGVVVHNCEPYYYLKSAIYDRRVDIYDKCDLLTEELVNLERESSGKIEHPEGGKYGSKDQADAFCGALFDASKFAEEYAYSYGESLATNLDVNEESTSQEETRRQLTLSFQEEIAKLYMEKQACSNIEYKQKQEELRRINEIKDGIIII